MGTRRKFTDEFKREAVKLATQPGATMSTIARELGVDRSVLSAWVRKMQRGRYEPAPGRPLKSESQTELEQVRRELARVKMERDILKKALGYFAKDRREVWFHCQASRGVAGSNVVRGPGSLPQRFLRMVRQTTEPTRAGQ